MLGSPSVYLLWSLLSSTVGGFTSLPIVITHDHLPLSQFLAHLIFHLWNYDGFKCLWWRGGRQPGTFKRLMTYVRNSFITLLVFCDVFFWLYQLFLPRDS